MKNLKNLLYFLIFLATSFTSQAQQRLLNEEDLDKEPVFIFLAEALKNPTKVYKLNLSRQQLKEIPKEIYQFVNLQRIDLSYNNITEIPKEIGLLKNLQSLDLTKNQIKELPATISLLIHLDEFLMGDNLLQKIPDGMLKLKRLTLLELENNKIPQKELTKLQKAMPKCEIIYE
jgi:Leucine-rich repeat (LRR) protein